MKVDSQLDKVLGCVVGASIGDSIGGPLEMATAERVRTELNGADWIDDMRPYRRSASPHGVWVDNAPKGTGTDDTRYNQIFLESVIKHRGKINAHILAEEYIERYRHVERYYPKYITLAREQLRPWYSRCSGYLGIPSDEHSDIPVHVLDSDCFWGGFPAIVGLLVLSSAGLLWAGEPQQAYEKTFELAFCDLGYAKDATAMLATMIAMSVEGQLSPREIVQRAPDINPYAAILNGFTGRQMTKRLEYLFELADGVESDRMLMNVLARECEHLHVFDPVDVLCVPMTIIYRTNGHPMRSILMACNHRILTPDGKLLKLRNIDCVGYVTGALVGAMRGLSALPDEWVSAVLKANRTVYGFDLVASAENFYATVFNE